MKGPNRDLTYLLDESADPPETMAYRFGHCRIDVPARELRCNETARTVGPKVFDLLLFLIERRHRVVAQSELRAKLWRGMVISDTVLSRTVMKARQAIGDDANPPRWLRTVYGHGYRFTADGVEAVSSSQRAALEPATAPSAAPLRIGLLPFDDQTGERQHGWVRLGLPSLVSQTLELDTRISTVGTAPLAKALQALPANQQRSAQRLCSDFGLQHLVQATLRWDGAALSLDYRLTPASEAAGPRTGTLTAPDATALAEPLARVVSQALFAVRDPSATFTSQDAFASEAYARARQAIVRGHWAEARHLLQVVLDIEPGSAAARLEYLHMLGNLADPQTHAFGVALLADAERDGDTRLQAMAHQALGHASTGQAHKDSLARARHHLAQALHLARLHDGEDWVSRVYLVCAMAAHFSNDLETARHLYALTERACRASGDIKRLAHTLDHRAHVDMAQGRLLAARDTLQETIQLYRQSGRVNRAAVALSSLAALNGNLGLMDLALRQSREAMVEVRATRDVDALLSVLVDVLYVCVELGAIDDATQALELADRLDPDPAPFVGARLTLVRGLHAGIAGNDGAARQLIRRAVDMALEVNFGMYVDAWLPRLLELELHCGDAAAAEAVMDEMRALAWFGKNAVLQAAVMHATAGLAHLRGDRGSALATLLAAAESAPAGRTTGRCTLDAAWLLIEADETAQAQRLLQGMPDWTAEHPLGLAVSARLQAARGGWEPAVQAQERSLGLRGAIKSPYYHELLTHYRGALARPPLGHLALPTAPCLPSLL